MKTILLATNNQNKVMEMKEAFIENKLDDYNIISLKELNVTKEPIENGKTFDENSYIKASFYKKMFGDYLVIADDSGLLVDYLNGEPGVYSKRYSSPYPTPKKNRKKLIEALKDTDNHNAHFETSLCLIDEEDQVHYFHGETHGYILDHEVGSNGFGYDAIFYSTEINKPFGLISMEEKNEISHRGKAIKLLVEYLKKNSK